MAGNAGSMRILIKGGKVVNDDFTQEADVYIENGIIQQVGKELMIPGGAKVIDASGKLVLPGGIDTSVHLQQTFMNATIQDDFYSGTKPSAHRCQTLTQGAMAALMGGTTMVMSMALPEQHCSLVEAYENCRALADAKACCDYALHVGVTWWGPMVRSEMETLVREHGVNSFQMTRSSNQTLQTCKDIGAIARVHAENGELVAEGAKEALDLGISGPEGIEISRPEELESEATHRAITVANRVRWSMLRPPWPHAVLSGMQYYHQEWAHAAAHVVVPPLRPGPQPPNYLMGLLGNDTLSVLASEHRPFCTKQRALGKEDFTKIPHGLAGVQDRMSVLWERGVIDENRFVALTSSNAAKIYNIYPARAHRGRGRRRRGRLGPRRDQVRLDSIAWTISVSTQVQGGDFNLYEGMRCHGVPLVTISRGRLVCENGVFMCAEGSGKFYPLRTFPDFLYKKMVQREKSQALKGVDRDPYLGDVAKVATSMKKDLGLGPIDGETPTKAGPRGHQAGRDLHESSFSLSGSQVDDHIPKRSSARILAPPGGRSSGIW
ncbi:hypothetical protein CRUP_012909 [Coryphaenoides rupestris]|nr:hypothetical protein CRUP_012909 [Coryphaenoides rupestris]